jgi:amino acid adenylation domain-containing protein/non-ribosomal peptide synthase protein (TIGR01720 family)
MLCKIWADVLGLERVGITDDFFRIGGDSILSIQVSSRIRKAGFNCQVKDLFSCKTIEKLSSQLLKQRSGINILSEQGLLTGPFGLLPIQQWFVRNVEEGAFAAPNHWNQSFLVKVPAIDGNTLENMVGKLTAYHDMLRVRYVQAAHWEQVYEATIAVPALKTLDVSLYSGPALEEILTGWQSGFDLARGPLFQVGYLYGYTDGSARIWCSLHHMIVDAVSWRILAEDLKSLYEGDELGQKGSSYRQWVDYVKRYPEQHPGEGAYWKAQLEGMPAPPLLDDRQADTGAAAIEFDETLTGALLQKTSGAYHTEINDLLLTALAYALKDINGNDAQSITLEGHGRESIEPSIDHSHTVGWFTTMYPVRLELHASQRLSIQSIKECLRKVPNKGLGFGAFAVSKEWGYTHADLPPIRFNYLGQVDTADKYWQIVPENTGINRSAANIDRDMISINGMISRGKLVFNIVTRLGAAITTQLAAAFKMHLESIIRHCEEKLANEGGSYTPGDFKYVNISQSLLDALQSQGDLAGIYPANSLQQGFIYHALRQAADDAYLLQRVYDYNHALDVDKYIKAWELCIEAYPILRTAFNWEEELIQVIYKKGRLEYELHDMSNHSPEERAVQIAAIQAEDRLKCFNLAQPSLLRLHIVKQGPSYYTVIKTGHHIISDGWSGPILLTQLHQYYQNLVANRKISVKEDTAYIAAQEYINGNKAGMAGYWSTVLGEIEVANDINPLMSEPIDAAGYHQVAQPAAGTLKITGDRYRALKSFSQAAGITVNVIIQFAWHKLLQAYSSSRYSIVGTTVSGRDIPVEGIEESVGLYINTLPLVIDWGNDNTILAQLQQVQQQVTALSTHSFADLATLQKEGQRLFHSLFVFENYPVPKSDGKDTLSISVRNYTDRVDYPLSLLAYEQNSAITVQFRYDGKYLSKEKASRHISTLEHILDQVIAKTDQPHRQISLLCPDEYKRIIYEWNDTGKSYFSDKTIHRLFEEQVERTPDKVALVYEGEQLTYRQLNEKSNRLARHLMALGVKPADDVGLLASRGFDMIIGMYGIMKAGGAYVPIDPEYPADRQLYIAHNSGVSRIVSDGTCKLNCPDDVLQVLLNDDRLGAYDQQNIGLQVSSRQLAYTIYTSGSTGRPKGVMIEHHSVINLIEWVNNEFEVGEEDRLLFITSMCFDLSVYDVFGILSSGGTVVIAQQQQVQDVVALQLLLQKERITFWDSVPATMNFLMDEIERAHPSYIQDDLRLVFLSGDWIPVHLPDRIRKHFPNARPVSLGGATEAAIWSNYYRIEKVDPHWSSIPYGRPINNTSFYVLDEHLQPVPFGVVGEFYIGGVGVARGYANDEDKTAYSFKADPFRGGPEDRMYKTGDLVRYFPDGNLEYIGRGDFQVKIRGYRIELGEIESRLLSYDGIEQVMVLAKERGAGGKYLVGYYVSGKPVQQGLLEDYLRTFLPDYMIPSVYVHMERFPVTVNGKLDRQALPDPEFTREDWYEEPAGELELRLRDLYAEILGLEAARIGVRDDFFRLGGHSILAIQLAGKINRMLESRINVSSILQYKTIRQLSKHMEEGKTAAPGITHVAVSDPQQQLLSFAQERLWYIESYEGGTAAYNIPMVFKIKPGTDVDRLLSAIEQVVHRHEVLRTVIRMNQEGRGYQEVLDDRQVPLKLEQFEFDNTDRMNKSMAQSMYRVFRLEEECPVVVQLYTCNSGPVKEDYLMLIVHHIAFDAWSANVLMKELYHYYNVSGKEEMSANDTLPALPLQYKDYAVWQRRHLSGELFSGQLDYWKRKLSGYEALHLPTDKPRPAQVSYEGDNISFVLDEQLGNCLRATAQELEVSLFSLLLSGYYLLLAAYSGQRDIVIGSPVANRHYQETHDLVGFFVNTLALREYIDDEEDLVSFIRRVNASVAEAQLYQDLPFEKLVEELKVGKDSSVHPIFQALFVLQHSARGAEEKISELLEVYNPNDERGYRVAKFDLSLSLHDRGKEISGVCNYATSLFEREGIEHYVAAYKELLRQLAEIPGLKDQPVKLKALTYIDRSMHTTLMHDWNDTRQVNAPGKTLVDLFKEQVRRMPGNIAIVYQDRQLTYALLDERSDQLAAYLESKKVKAGDLVGICIERSLEMVVGVLGILKAGAAYVPIDPEYPAERIRVILSDLGDAIVLSSLKQSKLFADHAIETVLLDADWEMISRFDKQPLRLDLPVDNLAYVLYTSGSSGIPKGVEMPVAPLVNLILWHRSQNDMTEPRTVLQFSSLGFDLSFFEMFFAFSCAGKLILVPDEMRKDVPALLNVIDTQKITSLFLPFVLLESITQHITGQGIYPGSLKEIVVTAEQLKLSPDLLQVVKKGKLKLTNLYGPTETHVVTGYEVKEEDFSTRLLPPIGRPISNTTVYVLDPYMRPLPIGAIGELYIGGTAVARGYLNRPELTSERFVDNPFQTQQEKNEGFNGRLYKTGDLVRYLPDGNLEYIGRSDFQVKIRGYRIELGEIETRLMSYTGIEQAVVLVRERGAIGRHLVAYYVSAKPVNQEMLKSHLRAFLPAYMVPSGYVHMERFPMTVNGKLDRKALPDPKLVKEASQVKWYALK